MDTDILEINDYFKKNSLLECVLIKYEIDINRNTFTLITDSINWSLPEGEREFKKLLFKKVRAFRRLTRENSRVEFEPNLFSAENTSEIILIQKIVLSVSIDSFFKIVIKMNYNFGSIEFEFMELQESKKIGLGKQVSDHEWVYIDKFDNHEFSFNDPFK